MRCVKQNNKIVNNKEQSHNTIFNNTVRLDFPHPWAKVIKNFY